MSYICLFYIVIIRRGEFAIYIFISLCPPFLSTFVCSVVVVVSFV